MNSINKIARTAGLLYLLYVITSVIANPFGKFVFVEAPVTVNHIIAHESQFRIGFVISLFSVVLFLLAAWALYVLLKPVDKNLALLFLLLNLGGFAISIKEPETASRFLGNFSYKTTQMLRRSISNSSESS